MTKVFYGAPILVGPRKVTGLDSELAKKVDNADISWTKKMYGP